MPTTNSDLIDRTVAVYQQARDVLKAAQDRLRELEKMLPRDARRLEGPQQLAEILGDYVYDDAFIEECVAEVVVPECAS